MNRRPPDQRNRPVGITCPNCGRSECWSVRDTKRIAGAIRRYRVCRCGFIAVTIEKLSDR